MGSDIVSFLTRINVGYFIQKINPHDHGVFCPKATLKSVRKYIKDSIHWYECQEEQRRLREELKAIEKTDYEDYAIHVLSNLTVYESDGFYFKDVVNSIKSEPWHFLATKKSGTDIFLEKIFAKLKKQLERLTNV